MAPGRDNETSSTTASPDGRDADSSDAERSWHEEGDWDDDDLDPEDVDWSRLRPRPTAMRLLLMAAVVFFAGWLVNGYREEIAFFFVDSEPVELGNAMDYVMVLGEDGQVTRRKPLDLPHNTYVHVRGIPVHIAVANPEPSRFTFRIGKSSPRLIYQLEGAKIFVEESVEDSHIEEYKALATQGEEAAFNQGAVPVEVLDLHGRLTAFEHDSEGIYSDLRGYYRAKYGMRFCSDLPPSEIERGKAQLGRGGMVLVSQDAGASFIEGASGSDASLHGIDFPNGDGHGFAAGSQGTLLKTEDGGVSWAPLPFDHDAVLYDAAFADDLVTGFVAGSRGHLWRTTDGGRTFSEPYPYVETDVRAAAVMPGGKTVFAVGGEGLVLKSMDGGLTWSPRPVVERPTLRDVVRTTGGALVVAGDDGLVLRSVDDGRTWAPMVTNSSAKLHDLSWTTDGQLMALGEDGAVLLSGDEGVSWTSADVHVVPGFSFTKSFRGAAAHPDGKTVAFVGYDGAFGLSTDGGRTVQLRSQQHLTGVVVEEMLRGSLPAALVAARHMAALPTLHAVTWVGDMAFAVGKDATLAVSDDRGRTWHKRTLPLERDTDLWDVLFVSPERGFIAGSRGLLLTTRNGGRTWERMDAKTNRTIRRLAQLQSDPAIVLYAGMEGLWGFWLEADDTWYRRSPETEQDYLGVAPRVAFDGDINKVELILVGTKASLIAYSDATESGQVAWDVKPAVLNDIAVAQQAISAGPAANAGEQTGIAVGRQGALFRSVNGGLSFQREPSGASVDLNAVVVTPDGLLSLVGGDEGVLLVDRGSERRWARLSFPSSADVSALALIGDADAWAFLVAAEDGLYRSTDLGKSFTRVSENGRVHALAATGERVYAAGAAGTVWASSDRGLTWSEAAPTGQAGALLAIWAKDERVAVAGERGFLARSDDSGSSWTVTATGVQQHLTGVTLNDSGASWAFGLGGTVLRSADAGRSWERQPPATNENLFGLFERDDGGVWVVGAAQTILHSEDRTHWSPRGTILSGLYAVTFPGGGKVGFAVGDDGAILKTTNLGETWTLRNSHVSTSLFDVAFEPTGTTGVAVGANGTLVRTRTAGDTWKKLTVDLRANLYAAAVVPGGEAASVVIAGEDGAAYVSDSDELDRFALAPIPLREDIRALALAGDALVAVGGQYEDPSTVCERGYVLKPDVTPRSHWHYVLMAVLVGGFALFTAVNLVRHVLRMANRST